MFTHQTRAFVSALVALIALTASATAGWVRLDPSDVDGESLEIGQILGMRSSGSAPSRRVFGKQPSPTNEPYRYHWTLEDTQIPDQIAILDQRLLNTTTTLSPYFLGGFIPGRSLLLMSDPGGEGYAYTSEPKTAVLDTSGNLIRWISGYTGLSASRVFSRDGKKILLLDNSRFRANRALVYTVDEAGSPLAGTPLLLAEDHRYAQTVGALSPSGTIAATTDDTEGLIKLRSTRDGQLLESVSYGSGGSAYDLLISADDLTVAVTVQGYGPSGVVHTLSLKRIRGARPGMKTVSGVTAADFAPRGDLIALANMRGQITVHKVASLLLSPNDAEEVSAETQTTLLASPDARQTVRRLRYSRDGNSLYAETQDGTWWKTQF